MKKLMSGLLFATLSAGLLAGCAIDTTTKVFDTQTEVYGFQTASAISLLHDVKFADPTTETSTSGDSSSETSSESSETPSEETSSEDSSSEDVTEEVTTVDVTKYLGIMEQLLSDSPIDMVSEASDKAEYAFKLTVTTTDLNGLTSTFVLYYNELIDESETSSEEASSEETTEVSEEVSSEVVSSEGLINPMLKGGGHHGHDDEDGYFGDMGNRGDSENEMGEGSELGEPEENEYRDHHEHMYGDDDTDDTTLEGIVIVNDVTYDLVGEKDEDEISFFVSIDENNWIKIAQEVNDSEEKYKYTIMTDGVKTRMSFKIETDDEGTKVTLKETIGADVYSYKFYKTTDDEGNEVIFIIAFEDGIVTHIKVTATVDETTGLTTYTYVTLESGHMHEDQGNHGYHDGGHHGNRD